MWGFPVLMVLAIGWFLVMEFDHVLALMQVQMVRRRSNGRSSFHIYALGLVNIILWEFFLLLSVGNCAYESNCVPRLNFAISIEVNLAYWVIFMELIGVTDFAKEILDSKTLGGAIFWHSLHVWNLNICFLGVVFHIFLSICSPVY